MNILHQFVIFEYLCENRRVCRCTPVFGYNFLSKLFLTDIILKHQLNV